MPSRVSFTDDERLIGNAAKNAFHTDPENTLVDAKRLSVRKVDDPEIKRDMKHWPFKVSGKSGKLSVEAKPEGGLKDLVSNSPRVMSR